MKKNTYPVLSVCFMLMLSSCTPLPSLPPKNECVILLHGLARTRNSMKKLDKYLSGRGYRVIRFGYPSTEKDIRTLGEEYIPKAIEQCREFHPEKIHFVTHSMGGIVVRQYLQKNSLPPGSRIVMISPPNRGSELTDYLKGLFFYKWRNGPAGQELGTGYHSTPNTLKPVNAEIGVITGNRTLNPLFSQLIPGPDDGKVSVERAKLKEMKDFIVVPASHTFIMNHKQTMESVTAFLEKGRFVHKKN